MENISRHLLNFLLNSLWQVPLIAIVALLIDRLLRLGPATHRHLVWVAALVASVAVPMASTRRSAPPPRIRYTLTPDPGIVLSVATDVPSTVAHHAPAVRTIALARNTATVLLAAYSCFLLF